MDIETSLDEAGLVQRLRSGDAAAFRVLVSRHHSSMVRVAATFVGDHALAEDVAQETWLAVIRGIHSFEGRSTLRSWVFAILVNRARTAVSRGGRTPVLDLRVDALAGDVEVPPERFSGPAGRGVWREPVSPWQDDPELRLASAQALDAIRQAVDELPPLRRQVVILRDIEGWTAAEVAQVLGISDGNQRVLLHRARTALRLRLESGFDR